MGFDRSKAVTVVVLAPVSPPPRKEEGVKPDKPKEENASLVLRGATPVEEEVEEDSPVGRYITTRQSLPLANPCVIYVITTPGISKVSMTSRLGINIDSYIY